MRVSRKGHVVSALEADWLELTAAYYRKGWSLVDSFVYWDTPKGWFDGFSCVQQSRRQETSPKKHPNQDVMRSSVTGLQLTIIIKFSVKFVKIQLKPV